MTVDQPTPSHNAQNALFRSVFLDSPDAIFVEDQDGVIVDVNPAACRLHAMTHEELCGKRMLDLVPESVRDEVATAFPKWFSGELDLYQGFSVDVNGLSVPVEIRSSKMEYEGRPVVILYVRDVSRRAEAELALRKSEEQLWSAQKMEALGRLAGGVAHDFNNLLTSILGFGNLVLEDLSPDAKIYSDIEEIVRAGERATALTKQLLALGRRKAVALHAISLNAVVIDTDRLLRRTLGEDIELVSVFGEGMGSIEADVGQIEQIIMNLAVNSRDAMPEGGTLTILTDSVTFNKKEQRMDPRKGSGKYAMLSVRDTGSGISSEIRNHVFEPFFTTKSRREGTGLGLSTVYGIVARFGGFIELLTEVGKGAEFRIFFPQIERPAENLADLSAPIDLPRGTEMVLVVEDEDTVRHLTVRILESLGYKVRSAANGGEALLFCEGHAEPIDLILTDVIMPQMSGRELIERLRDVRSDFKTLYMTGFTQDTVIRHGEGGSAPPVLSKPFTRQGLALKVRYILDNHHG